MKDLYEFLSTLTDVLEMQYGRLSLTAIHTRAVALMIENLRATEPEEYSRLQSLLQERLNNQSEGGENK